MKRHEVYIIICIILVFFVTLLPSKVLANSGPVYWQGYPSSEVISVEENSPITVSSENLIIDFSNYEGRSYAIDGKVTATYLMKNPTNQAQTVQMAFPIVEELRNFKANDVEITADGSKVPYDIYIGDVVRDYGNNSEEDIKKIFDFTKIISTISKKYYEAENFKRYEKGKLYKIDVNPTTEQRINFVVDFKFDFSKTKVFTKGFNRYERNDEDVRIAAWCYEPETLEIFVLGEDFNIEVSAFSDGELKEKTDLFSHQVSTQEMEVESYIMKHAINNENATDNEQISIAQQNIGNISDMQLYNMYAKALDKYFGQNMGYSSDSDLTDQWFSRRVIVFVYTVEFSENSEKEISVSYNITGTMDMRETAKPLYYFDYVLNPAKKWSTFKNLNIKIITPKEAPYIVESSIQLEKVNNNTYTVFLESLPEEDFFFTLYSSDKVTKIDKSIGRIWRSLGYYAYLFLGFGVIIFAIVLFIIILFLKMRNKKRL